jgi:hexosaminidase
MIIPEFNQITRGGTSHPRFLFILLLAIVSFTACATNGKSDLFDAGITLIPYPQEAMLEGEDFVLGNKLSIVLDGGASKQDRFTASELASQLQTAWGVNAEITHAPSGQSIILTHMGVSEKMKGLSKKKAAQGYDLTTGNSQLVIRAKGATGLFYGTQTLLQIIKKGSQGAFIPGLKISDWPDIPERAAHYDTKHHQDKREYVESFIRDLARYKINMLVWEWEDKFEYPSHPEIGAPGAFTMEEMQEITRYAQKYHVQLVPLVQGLGHVSFILKWPQYNHLREIPASNWEFCPLKDGSYELLFDLWEDAIEATPGSKYIHIGSDETYELGLCEQCQLKSEEIGKSGLYTLFTNRADEHLKKKGRKTMCWERPMGWKVSKSPALGIEPSKNLVLTESYSFETSDFKHVREATELGYESFIYDPNPGVVPLMVPYLVESNEDGKTLKGSIERSYEHLTSFTKSGYFDGMINTSWDDAGLHNQAWMMSFVNSAEWSWSGGQPGLEEFIDKFFLNYYGEQSSDMRELYLLLCEASFFYYESFERRVWHFGDIGKTHLPDLPRGDNLEYDEFWNREYAARIDESKVQARQMERAMEIIRANQDAGVSNAYDLELFTSIAALVNHTCNTYLAMSDLEKSIKEAHNQRYVSHEATHKALENAVAIIESNLAERETVYQELVTTWEKTRLPKGLSTNDKEFFHRMDRARHFAFRKADMSYLICDEELLGLEEYLVELKAYMEYVQKILD